MKDPGIVDRVNKENVISGNYKTIKCKGNISGKNNAIVSEIPHTCILLPR